MAISGLVMSSLSPANAASSPTVAVAAHAGVPGSSETVRREAWGKSRKAVLRIAKKHSEYTGYTVSKGGQVLQIYGTSKSPQSVRRVAQEAQTKSGIIVRWAATADYSRKELHRAARTLKLDGRVVAVRVSPTEGGYLAVRFKTDARLPGYLTSEALGKHFGVDVPVIEIARASPARQLRTASGNLDETRGARNCMP